jgi:GxxExxY protein
MNSPQEFWSPRQYDHLTSRIIRHAIGVHSDLGPGLLENVYEQCLVDELRHEGLSAETQIYIPITYKNRTFESAYRADILVENRVLVELKCVDKMLPVHEAQLLTYIRLGGFKVGLLINFNEVRLKDGLKRFVNDF